MPVLPDAEAFRGLVDGSRRGAAAALARAALGALAVPYGAAVRARNSAYDLGILPARRAKVPVISVGNLTLGGTGKTPLVAWTARRCLAGGRQPAIVSRGYGAARGQTSDEAAELALVLPGVPHVADRDRVAAAVLAVSHGAQAIVLDDGFQHRRLARDLDIVAVDATDPFGCGHLFPRGMLREPLGGLARAHAVVLTRADAIEPDRRREIIAALADICRGRGPRVWAQASHAPHRLRTTSGRELPLDAVRGKRVAAFCGIGNPAAFHRTLERLGAEVIEFRPFADHHAYTAADVATLGGLAAAARADLAVTTLKDLVKLPHEMLRDTPLAAVEIAIEFLDGETELDRLVQSAIRAGPGAAGNGGTA
ncbi:MAG: tetraacyldisaccharide 4'-kinase [Planctomycetia bacterium]